MSFDHWFEQQHGKRPMGLTCAYCMGQFLPDENLEHMAKLGEQAKADLALRREYDARRESALYAWQAKEKGEK